jgi:hypothetical protein
LFALIVYSWYEWQEAFRTVENNFVILRITGFFGCSLSGILKNTKEQVSEIGYVSILR